MHKRHNKLCIGLYIWRKKQQQQDNDAIKQREFVHQHYQSQNTKYRALQGERLALLL